MQQIQRAEIEDIRRAELIEAVIKVIAASGSDAATVRNIAKAAGVSTASIHYYFASKEELLSAAFRDHDRKFNENATAHLAESGSARERLVMLSRIGFPGDDSANVEWALILAAHQLADRHESLKVAADAAHERWLRLVHNVIADGVNTGEFRAELEPQLLAIEFAALYDGLGIYFYSKQLTSDHARRAIDEYVTSRLVSESRPAGSAVTSSVKHMELQRNVPVIDSIFTTTEPEDFSE